MSQLALIGYRRDQNGVLPLVWLGLPVLTMQEINKTEAGILASAFRRTVAAI
jgi:hypothetical protein